MLSKSYILNFLFFFIPLYFLFQIFNPAHALAATNVAVGTFNATTSATQAITGTGFQPEAIIFLWTATTTARVGGGAAASTTIGVGFASGPAATSSAAISYCSESSNSGLNSDVANMISTSTIIILSGDGSAVANCGVLKAKAILTSMDSNGFTLKWTTTSTAQYIIYYMAIGGADITNTAVGSFLMQNTLGTQTAVSSLSFQPDFVMVMSANTTSTYDTVFPLSAGGRFALGFSTNTTSTQAGIGLNAEEATAADTVSIASITDALVQFYAAGNPSAVDGVARINSMTSTGFEMDILDGATNDNTVVFYLAIKGGQFKVSDLNQATSAGDQTISGVGFQPQGVFFMTNAASSTTPYARQNNAVLSLGYVASATSSIGSIGYADVDGDTTPDPDTFSTSTQAITMMVPVAHALPTQAARAVVDSYNSDGFVLNWPVADNATRRVLYWAVGDASAAVPTISCSTDKSSTAFGVLTASAVSTSTSNASTTISCANTTNGCALYINDAGGGGNPGLWNSTSSKLIASPNVSFSATTTLAINTEGYGIRATSTATGSGALNFNSRYSQAGDWNVNTVGGLATTTKAMASSTADVTNREVVVVHKAAASSTTISGSYNDTITYSCLLN